MLCFFTQTIGDAEDIYSSVSGNTFWHRLGFIFFRPTARPWIQRVHIKKFLDKPGKIVRIVFATHAIIISYFAIQESSRKSLYAFDGLICVGQKQMPSFWRGPLAGTSGDKWQISQNESSRERHLYEDAFCLQGSFSPKGDSFFFKRGKWQKLEMAY